MVLSSSSLKKKAKKLKTVPVLYCRYTVPLCVVPVLSEICLSVFKLSFQPPDPFLLRSAHNFELTMAVKKTAIDSGEVGMSSSNDATPSAKKTPKTPKSKTPKSSRKGKSSSKATPDRRNTLSASKDLAPQADVEMKTESVSKKLQMESSKKSSKKGKSASKATPDRRKSASKDLAPEEDVEMKIESVSKKLEMESPKKRKRSKSEANESVVADASDEPTKEPAEQSEAVTKAPPVLNSKVHRMRHLNLQPKAILCMAPTPHHPQACDYVAVSREGGSVALKSPDEKWRTLASVAGMSSKTVDTMAWTCGACEQGSSMISFSSEFHKSHTEIHSQRTLVGASKDGTLFVVDFARGGYSAVTGSGGGGVFSLTSLCGSECCKQGTCPGLVAAGCEDGSARIYKLKHVNGEHRLDLVSTVPTAGASILSLAWCRYEGASSNGMNGTVLYTGVADGTIRRYECKSDVDQARKKGSIVDSDQDYGKQTWSSKIRMTVESYGRTTPTRIWALKALKDGTIVSGDSLGHVQFWDGKTGTLLHSFEQNDKKADILALAVTPDECQVFASGIDSRVICIERPTRHDPQDGLPRWIMTQAQRPHTHDVKALAVCRVHDTSGSLVRAEKPFLTLCSGGVDTKICTILVERFKNGRPRVWFPWPTHSPVSVARESRVLLLRREDTIELHQLGPQQTDSLPMILDEEKRFIGTMDIQSSHNLVCSDISCDGKYVVASTGSTLLLFEIEYIENADGTLGFAPKQIDLQNDSKSPCLAVKFASADTLVCAYSSGHVRLLKLSSANSDDMDDEETAVAVASVVDSFEPSNESANNLFAIHSLVVSEDGQFFATVSSGVGSGTVSVFAVKDNKIQQHWSVSALEAPVSSVGFLPGSRRQLAVACSNYAMYVFDLKERKLSEWSEKSGFPVSPALPEELNRCFDFPKCVISNPKTPEKFLLVSNSFGC